MDQESKKTLTQIVQLERPRSCDLLQKRANEVPPQAICVLERYGDAETFLKQMNPSTQIIAAENIERVYKSKISLTKVRLAFGLLTIKTWLMAQLEDLNEYAGVQQKMTIQQMEELSEIIIISYGYLKAPEILLFLHRFKKGQYGQFYGSVDPMKIAAALDQHVKDRQGEISRIEAEEYKRHLDAQREERARNSISREVYERRKIMNKNLNKH